MNQKFTRREMRMAVVLPAVLIAGLYALFFERPHRQLLDAVRQKTEIARRDAVPGDLLAARKSQAFLLDAQLKLEQRRAAAATRPSLTLPARWTTPSGRFEAMASISAVLSSHALFVVSTTPLRDGSANLMASKPLQDFVAAVAHEGRSPVPEAWRVDVLGSYADLLAALQALDRRDSFIVPLGVSMEPIGPETTYRKWSVWFWL